MIHRTRPPWSTTAGSSMRATVRPYKGIDETRPGELTRRIDERMVSRISKLHGPGAARERGATSFNPPPRASIRRVPAECMYRKGLEFERIHLLRRESTRELDRPRRSGQRR